MYHNVNTCIYCCTCSYFDPCNYLHANASGSLQNCSMEMILFAPLPTLYASSMRWLTCLVVFCSTQLFVTLHITYLPRYTFACNSKNGALTGCEEVNWARLHRVVCSAPVEQLNKAVVVTFCVPVGPYQNYNEQAFQGKSVR